MAILFRKHERLSNLAQNSGKRYILQLYINTAIRKTERSGKGNQHHVQWE